MAENSISYGMGLSDQMINQMLQSDDPTIKAQAQDYINQSQTQQEEKPSLLQRIGNFFISPAASAEVDINQNQNTLDENQLNYLLRSSYLPSGKGIQGLDSLGVGPNLNYLGKGMQGLESLGIGPNLNYLGDGTMTGSIGVGPNQNYLGKGMQIGSIGQPRYDSGTQTIFTSNMSPALSDLGGITPSFGVANEDDDEQDQEYIDQVNQSNNKFGGIMDLLMGIAIPGYGLFKNIAQGGLEGLKGFNQRLQQSDFAQADNLMDYLDMRKYGGAQGRRDAAARNMAQARGITKSLASRPSSTSGGYQQGPGGSGAQRTGASKSQSQAGPGFSGSGSAAEMGSF